MTGGSLRGGVMVSAFLAMAIAASTCTGTGTTPSSRGSRSASATSPSPEVTTLPSPSPRPEGIQVHYAPGTIVRFFAFNLAVPPFDDVHVRRAVAYAVDRSELVDATRVPGYPVGAPATHLFPDVLEGDVLEDFDAYPGPDLVAAHEEMRRSKYDTDADGLCEQPVCHDILTFAGFAFPGSPYFSQAKLLARQMRPLGITLDVRACERCVFNYCHDPSRHIALCVNQAFGSDYPDAVTLAAPLLDARSIGPDRCCNVTMLGATPETLRGFHYRVRKVPDVQWWLRRCEALVDGRQACWADLDRHLMLDIVPVIPVSFDITVDTVSENIVRYTWDVFGGILSLDHIAPCETPYTCTPDGCLG